MISQERMANWLAQHGIARSRILWQIVYAIAPTLAGLVSTFAEALEPENQLVWWYDPASDITVIEGVLGEIAELINRAPTPLGLDGYQVFVTSLGAVSGDEQGLTGERADATLNHRPAKSVRLVKGNRWHDWKRGNGKEAVRAVLNQFQPRPEAPVTLIQVAVTGSGVGRTLRTFRAL